MATGSWQGKFTGGYETATKVAGLPEPATGKIYRRKRNVYSKWRWLTEVTSFSSLAGTTVTGDDQTVTNGADTPTYAGEPSAIITSHELEANPPGSGIWIESQVIEGFTEWAEFTIPT